MNKLRELYEYSPTSAEIELLHLFSSRLMIHLSNILKDTSEARRIVHRSIELYLEDHESHNFEGDIFEQLTKIASAFYPPSNSFYIIND